MSEMVWPDFLASWRSFNCSSSGLIEKTPVLIGPYAKRRCCHEFWLNHLPAWQNVQSTEFRPSVHHVDLAWWFGYRWRFASLNPQLSPWRDDQREIWHPQLPKIPWGIHRCVLTDRIIMSSFATCSLQLRMLNVPSVHSFMSNMTQARSPRPRDKLCVSAARVELTTLCSLPLRQTSMTVCWSSLELRLTRCSRARRWSVHLYPLFAKDASVMELKRMARKGWIRTWSSADSFKDFTTWLSSKMSSTVKLDSLEAIKLEGPAASGRPSFAERVYLFLSRFGSSLVALWIHP